MSDTTAAPASAGRWTGTVPTNTAWIVLGAFTGFGLLVATTALDGGTWTDAVAQDPMTALGVATICYLTAAVTGLRWTAWAMALAASALPVVAAAAGTPRWATFAAVAAVLAVVGVVRRRRAAWPQTVALVGYLGVAVAALFLAPRIGLGLAGLALAAHAGWDYLHYRRDAVVNRSLALWCIGLDVVLGGLCVVLAF